MKLLDLNHPSFRPLWMRVAVVLVCFTWGLVELSTGATLWAIVFLGLGVICAYRFATIDYSMQDDGGDK